MKRIVTAFFVLALMVPAFWAVAQGSPVLVSHAVTGNSAESPTTMELSLQVTNPGRSPLTALVLRVVPMSPLTGETGSLEVGNLAPRETRRMSLQLQTHAHASSDPIGKVPLMLIGTWLDAEGNEHRFSATSFPGGAK